MRNGIAQKSLSLLLLCLCFVDAAAQEKQRGSDAEETSSPPVSEVRIVDPRHEAPGPDIGFIPAGYQSVQEMPQFPGGEQALNAYLEQNLQYPEQAREKKVQGSVAVEFDVEADGTLKNIDTTSDIGSGCAAEAIRLVRNMPPWQPGKKDGKAVKVNYKLEVYFVLPQ